MDHTIHRRIPNKRERLLVASSPPRFPRFRFDESAPVCWAAPQKDHPKSPRQSQSTTEFGPWACPRPGIAAGAGRGSRNKPMWELGLAPPDLTADYTLSSDEREGGAGGGSSRQNRPPAAWPSKSSQGRGGLRYPRRQAARLCPYLNPVPQSNAHHPVIFKNARTLAVHQSVGAWRCGRAGSCRQL